MRTAMALVGMTIGSWIGWWIGAQIGFITACYVSLIGSGIGLYAGRVAWNRYGDHFG